MPHHSHVGDVDGAKVALYREHLTMISYTTLLLSLHLSLSLSLSTPPLSSLDRCIDSILQTAAKEQNIYIYIIRSCPPTLTHFGVQLFQWKQSKFFILQQSTPQLQFSVWF